VRWRIQLSQRLQEVRRNCKTRNHLVGKRPLSLPKSVRWRIRRVFSPNPLSQITRAIQLYLGHRNIQHTVKYTALAAERFKDFWRDED